MGPQEEPFVPAWTIAQNQPFRLRPMNHRTRLEGLEACVSYAEGFQARPHEEQEEKQLANVRMVAGVTKPVN